MTAAPASVLSEGRALLAEARERTWLLIAPLSDDDLRTQHDPLMGPILWDLGHIAHFEELWLLHNTEGPIRFGEMPGTFNPFEHPRSTRGGLALPNKAEMLAVMRDVRERVLGRLDALEAGHALPDTPLLHEGYVFRMVAQHEHQHGETMLQTLQLKRGAPYSPRERLTLPQGPEPVGEGMVRFPGGEVTIGTMDRSAAYDNERPRHRVRLAPFEIDVAPVSNGRFLEFMRGGGYAERRFWSDAGWAWLSEAGLDAPKYWMRRDGEWWTRSMDRESPVDPRHPVVHVSYHEAEALARWAGCRLPTEQEWEAAATWDPAAGVARRFPWGDEPPTSELANVDQLGFGTAPIGAYPRNVSPIGCVGMIGDVWEWTSSDFAPYPDFEVFPYPEYSEPFLGEEYKVLRGGSWATRPLVARATFRNWDYPIRRQIFSGFRCARDA